MPVAAKFLFYKELLKQSISQKRKARLVVLISGQGSNLQVIIDACQQNALNANIAGVIANNRNAYGLERSKQAHIPIIALLPQNKESRVDYDYRLATHVATWQPDWIILSGWMRLLSNVFLEQFPEQVVNLHPALQGAFPGSQAIKRAFIAYQEGVIQHTGVMVHKVPDEGIDCGPVLSQVAVPIMPHDSLESLTERMHQTEHQLLLQTLRILLA